MNPDTESTERTPTPISEHNRPPTESTYPTPRRPSQNQPKNTSVLVWLGAVVTEVAGVGDSSTTGASLAGTEATGLMTAVVLPLVVGRNPRFLAGSGG